MRCVHFLYFLLRIFLVNKKRPTFQATQAESLYKHASIWNICCVNMCIQWHNCYIYTDKTLNSIIGFRCSFRKPYFSIPYLFPGHLETWLNFWYRLSYLLSRMGHHQKRLNRSLHLCTTLHFDSVFFFTLQLSNVIYVSCPWISTVRIYLYIYT